MESADICRSVRAVKARMCMSMFAAAIKTKSGALPTSVEPTHTELLEYQLKRTHLYSRFLMILRADPWQLNVLNDTSTPPRTVNTQLLTSPLK